MAGFLEGSSLPLLLPPRLILGEFQEFPRVLQVHLPAPGLPKCLGDLPRGSTQPPTSLDRETVKRRLGGRGGLQIDNFNKVDPLLSDRRAASLASPPPLRRQQPGPRSPEAAGSASGARDAAKIGQEGVCATLCPKAFISERLGLVWYRKKALQYRPTLHYFGVDLGRPK